MSHTFRAATWNVFHDTETKVVKNRIRALKREGVSLVLGQEFTKQANRDAFGELGWTVLHRNQEFVIAYDPDVFVQDGKLRLINMSETPFYRTGGKTPVYTKMLLVRLRHRPSGRLVRVGTYHTPAGIQIDGNFGGPVNRKIAVKEAFKRKAKIAKNTKKTVSVLFGGDDNADERRGTGWDFMLRPATGLRQIRAPKATHKGGRKIDDFRVLRLKSAEGQVIGGGGDHRIHIRDFEIPQK